MTKVIPSLHLNDAQDALVYILAGRMFNSRQERFLENQVITVSKATGLITNIQPYTPTSFKSDDSAEVINLLHLTVLPGFVDAHVHFFLHAYSETSWNDQVTKESVAERTIRATIHARKTLMAGFTTVRDLGTEGAGDADIGLRHCLSGPNPMIPGPRYFTANRAIVPPGSYGPRSAIHVNQDGVEGITGAEVAGGVDACVNAVRRQIGAGADCIKLYGDYPIRARMSGVSPGTASQSFPTFTKAEVDAMIDIAHNSDVKVAVHVNTTKGYHLYSAADSIEHGSGLHENNIIHSLAAQRDTSWVPTLSAYYKMADARPEMWSGMQKTFRKALDIGMDNIACGGDTGVFNHGENALEMKLMARLGAPYRRVLRWCTLGGWECLRPRGNRDSGATGDHDLKFGVLEVGWAADIVALEGDIEEDFEGTLDRIRFVMRGAKVYKRDGKAEI
ncbi:hypothetical protein BDZ89DRAFT_1041420 [Hymenopellis radicata]|nr:hypothetical protein BDZ89DRAFT_1041420 [Hymenopellis radicata]